MPLPAAWKPMCDVGPAGRIGSNAAACSDTQVHRSLRCSQLTGWATCDPILSEIRCRHVLGLSQEIGAPPASEPTSCPDSGQCSLSPRDHAATLSCGKASCSVAFISATLQPGIESSRTGMEAGEKAVHSQSVLSTAQRLGRCGNCPAGVVEETEPNAPSIMRHYLSRSV